MSWLRPKQNTLEMIRQDKRDNLFFHLLDVLDTRSVDASSAVGIETGSERSPSDSCGELQWGKY
jgi:hypothetical protein